MERNRIIIRNNIQNFKIEHLEIKPFIFKNRITHLRIHLNHPINIINIYAPANNSEKPNFYKAFYKYLEQISEIIILAGDFNYASEITDRFPIVNKYDKRIKKIFNLNKLNISDTFRKFNKNKQDFTHKASRIDKIYVSNFAINKIQNCRHLNFISDHKPVYIQMNLDEITFWGNFYWKFNNILLQDEFYCKEIFKNYGNRKQHQIPLNNWETCKKEYPYYTVI